MTSIALLKYTDSSLTIDFPDKFLAISQILRLD